MGASLLSNNDGGNDLQQKLASMLDYSVSLSDYSEKAIEIFLNDRPIEQVGLAVYEEDKGVLPFPTPSSFMWSLVPRLIMISIHLSKYSSSKTHPCCFSGMNT